MIYFYIIMLIASVIGLSVLISMFFPFIKVDKVAVVTDDDFDKSRRYIEIKFKHVNPRDNSVDEVTYLLDGEHDLGELYERINTGLIMLGYSDKCLEYHLGVDDE